MPEEAWIAIEREAVDAMAVRRRLRGKSAIRKFEEEDEDEKEKGEEKERRVKILRVIEEEMRRMVEDDAELAMQELQILAKLKQLAVLPNEEEEVLQTKIVSPREVAEEAERSWSSPESQDQMEERRKSAGLSAETWSQRKKKRRTSAVEQMQLL